MCDLTKYTISGEADLRQVIGLIDRNGQGIALVVDSERRLTGTITDGDVRRAMLAGLDLRSSMSTLLEQRSQTKKPSPITAPLGTPRNWLLSVMNTYRLRHVPLLDEQGRVVDLALLTEFVEETSLPLTAVVMAGGFGTRLRPLTDHTPKPMLKVGDQPLLERIVGNLHNSGIDRIVMTTHFKSEVIASHFGDGTEFGVDISYLQEQEPLGTAGALRHAKHRNEPLLVVNGDILTALDFRAMHDFHNDHQADLTIAVRRVDNQLPYGVVESDGAVVTSITEKPTFNYLANAGIYLLNADVCEFIPEDKAYQMTQLIAQLLRVGKRVIGFPIREYWRDIGRLDDYQQAQIEISERKVS